ncbi:glutamate--tRNA ligase [archaeon]|nr:glutamate--tRNA ligase [archaeon]
MEKEIRKLIIQNAKKFNGKASPGAVIGSLIAKDPKIKPKLKEISKKVNQIIKEVNSLPLETIEKEYKKLGIKEIKHERRNDLPEIKVKGKIVTRLPPEPSKYPHLGHILSFLINYMYAQKYKGDCVLRFDDTNPEKAKKEYYKATEDMLKWLNVKYSKKVIASNDMKTFYKYAEQLIKEDGAYICFCNQEKMRDNRSREISCEHRNHNSEKNLREWKKMLDNKYEEGEITLRLRGDMTSQNAALRDPVLFRLAKKTHPLQGKKYIVWPMYDFETAIEENLCGITHIFRDNTFGRMRIELQDYIKDLLGLKKQEVRQYGRFNIVGAETSGRKIRELIEKKKVTGWDDPRLVTAMALKRRGFIPETFFELVKEVGLSQSNAKLDWTRLSSINRRLIDDKTKRIFFIEKPQKIKIEHHFKEIEIPNHPEKDLGKRKLKLNQNFYISEKLNTKPYRLMNLFNFKKNKFISKKHDPKLRAQIIDWIPVNEAIDINVLMNNGKWIKGKADSGVKKLKKGEIIQFQKQFFARLDNKEKMEFIYTHE